MASVPEGFELVEDVPQGFELVGGQDDVSQPDQSVGDMLFGAANIVGSAITGLAGEGIKGLSTVGGLLTPGQDPQQAVLNAEALQSQLPVLPIGEEGQALLANLAEWFKDSPEIVQEIFSAASTLGPSIGESGFQAARKIPVIGEAIAPTVGALAGAVPGAIEAITGLRGGRTVAKALAQPPAPTDIAAGVGRATNLIDQNTGLPSPEFDKALSKRGLTIDNVGTELLTLPTDIQPTQAVNAILKKKLIANDSDDALATLRISPIGVIEEDAIAKEALRQGFQAGDIQAAKTATPETKRGMAQMTKIMRRIKANSKTKPRPTDVVGKAVMRRFSYIRDAADTARKELDTIARTKLKGLNVNTQKIQDGFLADLDDLDITIIRPEGSVKPVLDFEGSLISKDKTSQGIIQDAIDLLSESNTPNALRAHKLKKQLDAMLDFNKKSAAGLTDAGKKIAGNLRKSLNNSIRDVSDEYGAVNDVLHESITALDEFQRVLGPSIDVFKEGAAKAIGTDMRGLLSNRKSRVRLENSINALDDTAKNLGGGFDDSIHDLTNFANILDDHFGAVAKTSLKGEVGSAIRQSARGKAGFVEAGVDKAAEVVEKARGINEQNAFKSIEAILRRGVE